MSVKRNLTWEARVAPFLCSCCGVKYEDFVKMEYNKRTRRRCAPCRMRCQPGRIMACERGVVA